MKKFFKKLGFHKMDEMEQHIAFKAQRNAFVFLLFALFIWTLYESYKVYAFHSELNPFPCFLLAAASCIQIISQLIMTHNAVKDDEETPKTSPVDFISGPKLVSAFLIFSNENTGIFTHI